MKYVGKEVQILILYTQKSIDLNNHLEEVINLVYVMEMEMSFTYVAQSFYAVIHTQSSSTCNV